MGDYAITVTATGFEKTDIDHVAVDVGETETSNIQLKAGDVSETVSVSASTLAPNLETSENSAVINESEMKEPRAEHAQLRADPHHPARRLLHRP